MKNILLIFTLFFVSCDFKLVDDDKQKPLKVASLLQDMVTHKNIIYLISKDTIYYIHNIDNKLIKKDKLKPFNKRADFISIKKVLSRVYILDENSKIHVFDINANDQLSFLNSIKLEEANEATNFEVSLDNKIIISSSDIETEFIDIELLTVNTDSYIKFNTIKKPISSTYLKDNTLYTVGNLNKLTKYDLIDLKKIKEEREEIVPEKISTISANSNHLFLASANKLYVYDFNFNLIDSLDIERVNSFLFDGNYLYLSRGLNGISQIDISNMNNLENIKIISEKNKNYKKILFSQDKQKIIIMLSDSIKIIDKNDLKDIIKLPAVR